MVDYYQALGQTGLQRFGGLLADDYLPNLNGQRASEVFEEMAATDATCGGIIYVIDKLVRRVPWRVVNASTLPSDVEAAEHFESCLHDMDTTWTDTISEMMSMVHMGFSLHEIVLKRRMGKAAAPWLRSRYRDGRVGIRGLPIRAQTTLYRWEFDDNGEILGAEQIAPPNYRPTMIPMDKALLFRTSVHMNNPLGRSIFRHVYKAWYCKKTIEAFEAIGVEKDNVGMPVFYLLEEYMRPEAQAHQKQVYEAVKRIGQNIKQDRQSSLFLPMDRDGKRMVEYQPAGSPGSKMYDTDKIIQRYDQRIAMAVLADFLLMGQSSSTTGSFSMHTDKTKMFALSLETFLDTVCETINSRLVPMVTDLNGFTVDDYPRLEHGKIEQQDLKVLGDYLSALNATGMELWPNRNLQKYLHEVASLPLPEEAEMGDGLDLPGDEAPPEPGDDMPVPPEEEAGTAPSVIPAAVG